MDTTLVQSFRALAEALLIGLLIGMQREATQEEPRAGVRDFILIALTGALCGLAGSVWLGLAALAAIVAFLAVLHIRTPGRSGVTTEIAAITTFTLGYLTTQNQIPHNHTIAVATTIVVAAFLEAKAWLTRLIRERITETEFNDTLRFLAVIFIIYPVLPEGRFGPHDALDPRLIWRFVILVASISYVGYFLEKFVGRNRGVLLTALLGGVASTTAVTASLARTARERPQIRDVRLHATILANAIQFPRLLGLLALVEPPVASHFAIPALVMTVSGILLSLPALRRDWSNETPSTELSLTNPFQLAQALRFGAVFTLVMLVSQVATKTLGSDVLPWVVALAGLLDVDAVAVTVGDMFLEGSITGGQLLAYLFITLAANAFTKSLLATLGGGLNFGLRVGLALGVMIGSGILVWLAL